MELDEAIGTRFGERIRQSQFRENRRIIVGVSDLLDLLTFLKSEHGFAMLFELTAVDYLEYPDARDRYGVVYGLVNPATGERRFVKTFVNDPAPTVPTVTHLWKSASWFEREVFDMFGIVFEGHADLRRILLPPEFSAYPLRKDYPLRGRGERHNLPVLTRAES
jgi:NADH-quinone oxidoreductase subunit C